MIIRQEQKSDSEKVYQVVQKAFEKAERCDGNEQDLVVALRKSAAYVPELSLVAEENGEVIAHILFTKIRIGDQTELALAPLSVLPEYQHQGIGKALMARGHQIAAEMGYGFSVVLGSEEYYPKAGYVPAEQYGIQAPFDVPSKNYMALDLQGKPRKLNGTVAYAREFFEV
ncbi:MAG: N-acetyltransferase [Clostridium sp.]|nr:N-acetyltransferase [Clostridium sp.]MDU6307185.1 N-acetyltransferase [Clostridium sp.]